MKRWVYLSVFVLLSTVQCRHAEEVVYQHGSTDFASRTEVLHVINQGNDFGFRLFSEVATVEPGNLMLSPLSANVALSMLMNGSRGVSLKQLMQVMGMDARTNPDLIHGVYGDFLPWLQEIDADVELNLANGVFYRNQMTLHDSFRHDLYRYYQASVKGLDFDNPASVDTVNTWASDQTRGLIPQVIEEIAREDVLFLLNALYFKGTWTHAFDPDATAPIPFLTEGDQWVDLPTMTGLPETRHLFADDFQAMEMDYGDGSFSMVVVVPAQGLPSFLEGFDGKQWNEIVEKLDAQKETKKTRVFMPVFEFKNEVSLNDPLKNLGLTEVFEPSRADLSGISDWDMFVSFIRQHTYVEVNEEGTEAAAVTSVGVSVTSFPGAPSPPVFRVDRPFLFAVRERTTGVLLFLGKVEDPRD